MLLTTQRHAGVYDEYRRAYIQPNFFKMTATSERTPEVQGLAQSD